MEDLVAAKQQLDVRLAQLNEARSLLQDQAARLEQTSTGFSHNQVTIKAARCCPGCTGTAVMFGFGWEWEKVMTQTEEPACPCQQELRLARKEINSLQLENSELRREVHRWRKKLGVFRLRLASSEEDAAMFEGHILATATHADTLQAQTYELGSAVDVLQAAREADAAQHQAAMQQQARQYEVRPVVNLGHT
jgi:hypothetical protein